MLFSFALCSLLLLLLLRLLVPARLDSCKVFVTGRGEGGGLGERKGRGEKGYIWQFCSAFLPPVDSPRVKMG